MTGFDPLVGTLFAGRFEIERLLAAGGMGAVYVAVQHPAKRRVALKVIRASGALHTEMIARFEREVQMLASIHHPNIVTMFDSGSDNGNIFVVMELLHGRSLRDELEALKQ